MLQLDKSVSRSLCPHVDCRQRRKQWVQVHYLPTDKSAETGID